MQTFNDLHLPEALLKSIADSGYTTPTPIQAQAIPLAVAGRDLQLSAQTGSGKTAAFVLELTEKTIAENRLTAMMVTHSMRQALDYGSRTVMLHQGRVVLDVGGEKRAGLDVSDLLELFGQTRGGEITDDSLLLD